MDVGLPTGRALWMVPVIFTEECALVLAPVGGTPQVNGISQFQLDGWNCELPP
jgi:hypothetical protein